MKRFAFMLWRMSKADLGLLWFAIKHPARPGWLLPTAILLGLYALSPLNFAIPLLGIVDDMVIVPLALHALLKLLPQQILHGFHGRVLNPRAAA